MLANNQIEDIAANMLQEYETNLSNWLPVGIASITKLDAIAVLKSAVVLYENQVLTEAMSQQVGG